VSKILHRVQYDHPVYLPAGVAAQKRHREVNGKLRTYFCGAYWRCGFHEDGVVSAMKALEHFTWDLAASGDRFETRRLSLAIGQ
jgi:predicted NAD/FAD-binding protein